MNIEAKIVADSLAPNGERLTTLLLTFPRIVHAELLTHRLFSRNAASSRAVPVKKMIESVRNNMFVPLAFQKSHIGMQGSEYFEHTELVQARQLWIESAELALQQAEKMEKVGITKQLINRVLEPYQYYQVLLSSTEFENFFNLRCPQYSFNNKIFKSKKDVLVEIAGVLGESDFNNLDDYHQWAAINKGQSEIHMMALAEAMYDALQESTPKILKEYEWHIPFYDKIDQSKLFQGQMMVQSNRHQKAAYLDACIKISVGMCARTSYTTVGDEKDFDYKKQIDLHDRLIASGHASPTEHVARVMSDDEYKSFFNSELNKEGFGWCKNFKGFIQYRYLLENPNL